VYWDVLRSLGRFFPSVHFLFSHYHLPVSSIDRIHMAILQSIVFIISTFLFFLVHPSQAWNNTARIRLSSRDYIVSKALPMPSSALHYQNGNSHQESFKSNIITNELDTELRLQAALHAARDADRRFGLCTPASTCAWQIVDDIYSSSSTSQHVEDSVKMVLGCEKSIWSLFERR